MAKETQLPIQRSDDAFATPSLDGMSSFNVWARTTMLDDDDDADLADHNVLRGID